MKNIILIAPQAAGKGTQAALIKEKYNIPHISTGDLLREEMAAGTEIGLSIKEDMNKGNLVSNEVITELLKKRITASDCQNGYILDGYPRNMEQAEIYENILKELKIEVGNVIYLNVPHEEVMKRITGRRMCEKCGANFNINYPNQQPQVDGICDKCGGNLIQRADDHEEAIKERLNIFYTKTQPLLDYYKAQNVLHEVDGSQEPNKVFEEIDKIIKD